MRRTTVVAIAAALSATLAVAGCSSSDGDGKAAKKQAAPQVDGQSINAHPVSDLKQGGSLRFAIDQWITQYNINQVDGQQGDAQDIIKAVLPDLFDADAKGTIHANPNFLVSAKVTSTSPQVVTYELNPKAKWSDGKPLSWKDFQAQWKALNGTDSAYEAADTSGYSQISKVEQGADAHGVKVTFSSPYADWQRLFDPLYPAAYIDTPAKFNKGWSEKALVTGNSFKVGTYDKTGQTVTIVPDPKWWGDKPKLDSVVYRVLDSSAFTEAYLNKEIDEAPALQPEDYKRLVKAPDTDIRRGARWDEVHITLNGGHGPLKDVKVRNAVQAAINRAGVNESFSKDLSFDLKPLDNHFFMPNQEGYQDTAGEYGKYDPERAKKLLDEAGWKDAGEGKPRTKDGKKLTLGYTLSAGGTASQTDQAELVQQMLGAVGIKVDLQKVPANDYFNKFVNTGNFDITSFRNVDAVYQTMLTPVFIQPEGKNLFQNFGSVGSPKIDELLNKAAGTTDHAEAIKLYNEADVEIWKLGHSIELYQRPQIDAVRKGLANFGASGLADTDYAKVGWLK
ncbi:ABC transporter family substrate-binding protein [Streptomyces sp. NBC_01387]|uniref:ABC transporter family substrate-binding protein n=1 Tax=unclassified Streptomyces TaxID=2593676 RepID=UPI0022583B6A|nr:MULTISPECIES: ABC transporter family substrate-binding protein [unclassified Streptomyces]MCX4548341.1 ABC transporter family substrate-binding protein [Streptomyces sp. NBC_01500]WSC19968.1 ABC transporter family substrate-binding protein [Streptomyces sp. NBC_01766]WSV53988.1 ABC transporter family substrate-binding protein [Streptomyces sp. NBC_01014]